MAYRRPGRSGMTPISNRSTPRPSISIAVHGATRRGPAGAAGERSVPPSLRCRTSRAFSPVERRPEAAEGLASVPPAARHQASMSANGRVDADQRLHSLRRLRRLPLFAERQGGRSGHVRGPGIGAPTPTCHAADQRLRHPAGDRRLGRTQRHRVCTCTRDGRAGALQCRRSSWSRPAVRCRPRCCCCDPPMTPIRTDWPTARGRSGATTCGITNRS